MKKLITFSLWGNDPKYCVGAIRNVELAPKIYPGWICRFYISMSTARSIGHDIITASDGNVEIHVMPTEGYGVGWEGMFWRFLPAIEDDVEVFISRDCDSRISEREALAVKEWMEGPKLIHVMRDHPHHTAPIMGGMWGAKNGALPDLQEQFAAFPGGDFWQVDQNFLREIVWPAHYHKILAHDDWRRFPITEIKPFPTPRQDLRFVGEILDAHDLPVYPEHNQMLEK